MGGSCNLPPNYFVSVSHTVRHSGPAKLSFRTQRAICSWL
jgi:hypothetical protein